MEMETVMVMVALKPNTNFLMQSKSVVPQRQCGHVFISCHSPKAKCFALRIGSNNLQRMHTNGENVKHYVVQAKASGLEDLEVSSAERQDFSVTISNASNPNEIKISVEVSGSRTQETFDSIFSKMVADVQPIPGFRRVKGGKTPNIPKDILMEFLGPSNVYKQVIKRIINSIIAEYVNKEGLRVGEDLQIEQSFEDLEAKFEPGHTFKFDAIMHYQATSSKR